MKLNKLPFDENIYRIINGDSMKVLDTLESDSVDSVICDPPYELGFMGKSWDKTGIAYNVELWKKVFRVLKSGGYLLAFGGSRTFHRIACAIEDAGFEIRDTIMWIYGSGFPKSMNIGLAIDKKNGINNITGKMVKGVGNNNTLSMNSGVEKKGFGTEYAQRKATNEWAGWGTALKPAYEPIIVARKPCEGSITDNVIKYGVGGINIDDCRVSLETDYKAPKRSVESQNYVNSRKGQTQCDLGGKGENAGANELGRFPSNVILTYDDTDFDEVCGGMPNTKSIFNVDGKHEAEIHRQNSDVLKYGYSKRTETGFNDEGSASRYFYCAKASKKDRDGGLDMLEERTVNDGRKTDIDNAFQRGLTPRKNIHPTVKPVELMEYLVRLANPKGATILDIFNGSGSTGKAVAFENREREREYKYIGIELDKTYCEISKLRIEYALNKYEYDMIQDIKKEEERTGQLSLFDFE